MLTEIFKALFLTSLIGTVLAAVLMLVKSITKRHFSSGWHYYIWLAVLVVMVLPVRFNLPGLEQSESGRGIVQDAANKQAYQIAWQYIEAADIVDEAELREVDNGIADLENFIESKMSIISFAWLIVAVLLFSMKIQGYILFRLRIMRNSESFFCPELLGFTRKKVIVRKSSMAGSPIMMGIFKPILVLPDADLTVEQLGNILAHEMTHFRRNDIAYKWFVVVVKCIHWFNPMVYFVSRQINIWCEISCDLAVVEHMNSEEERSYINTILALISASGKSENIPLATGMLGSKEALKRRFLMIKNKSGISKRAKLLSGIAATALLVGTLGISGVMAGNMLDEEATKTTEAANILASAEVNDTEVLDVVYEADNAADIKIELPEALSEDEIAAEYNYSYTEDTLSLEMGSNDGIKVIWPCPSSNRISATHSIRIHPFTGETIKHNGIDIAAPTGEAVVAAIGGEVTFAGWDDSNGYMIIISQGNIEIMYAHLSEICVEKGDTVEAGQSVAKVGNTGKSTGPHLHFELIIDGESVDPQLYK